MGQDQEWREWEMAYVSDKLYCCQIIDEKIFSKFLIDRWEKFKGYHGSLIDIEAAYQELAKTFKDYKHDNRLPNDIILDHLDINFVMMAYTSISKYSHLYSPNQGQFKHQIPLIFNIFNKNFMSLFEDLNKKIVQYVYVEDKQGQVKTGYYLSVPNLIAATKADYDMILREDLQKKEEIKQNELKQKNESEKPIDTDTVIDTAIDAVKLVKETKNWKRLHSEAGAFIIGDTNKILPKDIKYITIDYRYYMFSCQIHDKDKNVIDVRLPGFIYDFNSDGRWKQLKGKLNTYSSNGKIGIIPIEAADCSKLKTALNNNSVVKIDNNCLLFSFHDMAKNLLITDSEKNLIESIDFRNLLGGKNE
jgi:hypothetical protein